MGTVKKSFIVLQPNSRTNHTSMYRVVDYKEWLEYVNEEIDEYDYVEFDTYQEAKEIQGQWNNDMQRLVVS